MEAELELAEAVTVKSEQIVLCMLRLKDATTFKNRRVDVMIGSDDKSDFVV